MPKQEFIHRKEKYKIKAEDLQRKYNRLAIARIIIFLLFIVSAIYFANQRDASMLGLVTFLFLVIFGLILDHHNRIKLKKKQAFLKKDINEQEIYRLDHKWEFLDKGEMFYNEGHPYSSDLDLFGNGSLFQLLNRTSTNQGRSALANELLVDPDHLKIQEKQSAIRELSPQINWCQDFQVAGLVYKEDSSQVSDLLKWSGSSEKITNSKLLSIGRFILPVIVLVLLGLYFIAGISFYWVLLLLVVNGWVLKNTNEAVGELTEKTEDSVKVLKSYSSMIYMIEEKEFKAQLLNHLKSTLIQDHIKTSSKILKLYRILNKLQSRSNLIYWVFNIVLLLDIHWLIEAENWKNRIGHEVKTWFESIHQFEILISMAGFSIANPQYTYPKMKEGSYTIEGKNVGHPLVPDHKRICNDFRLQGKGNIVIVTGSNMSGKSTFLRTIGINSILCKIGAPVCASEMKSSVFRVFTSMRTHDNLEENISSFYAELKRIGFLLKYISDGKPVLFLLDEILKGTNSIDRHKGAEALIRQLSKLNSFGLVSTHDLELGKLENESDLITNYSFNSEIRGDEILFDYKLQKGLCYSFNASKLMQSMGIKIT